MSTTPAIAPLDLAKQLAELPERIAEAVAKALLGRRRHQGPGRGAERELLEKREVARRLGIKPHSVYDLIKSGQLEEVPCGARGKIRARDVERLVEEGWTKPGEEPAPAPARKFRGRRGARTVESEPPAGTAAEMRARVAKLKV